VGHYNRVIAMGTLVRDPKLRYAAETGTPMCFFQIAVNRPLPQSVSRAMREKSAELTPEEQDKLTDYPWCYAVGSTAEQCAMSLKAGSTIFLEGRLETRNYTDRQMQDEPRYCVYCGAALNGSRPQAAKSKKVVICPECRGELTIERKRSTAEIRVDEVEFLKNFKIKDEKQLPNAAAQ